MLTTEDATEDAMVEYALTISADDEETQALSKYVCDMLSSLIIS